MLTKVLRGYYMASPGNGAGFEEMTDFVRKNPDWPNLKDIRAIAEQKFPAGASAEQIIGWFAAHPPVTLIGFYLYIDALNATGDTQAAIDLIRVRWINGDFRDDDLVAFYGRFGRVC